MGQPKGGTKFCFQFAKTGSCDKAEECPFGHVSPMEAKKMGLSLPDDIETAKNEVAAATTTTVCAAMRIPVEIPADAMEAAHWHQDEAAKRFAATCEE